MKNYEQPGQEMDVVAAAAVEAGQPVKIGDIVGVASKSAAIGEMYALSIVGVYDFANPDAVAVVQGADVFYHVANKKIVAAAGAGVITIGKAFKAGTASVIPVMLPLGPRAPH